MKCCVLVFALCLAVTHAQSSCQELTPQADKKTVTLPSAFTVDIEVVDRVAKTVKDIKMYYSLATNMVRLDIKYLGQDFRKQSMFFYFDDDEVLTFTNRDIVKATCEVATDLTNNLDGFLLGGTVTKKKLPSPLEVFHFSGKSGFLNNNIVNNHIGKSKTRNKATELYNSCQQWMFGQNNIVVNITHQFADTGIVFPMSYKYSELLQMTAQGTGTVAGTPNSKLDLVYNFYNFHDHIKDYTVFETPDGVVCEGRKVDKPVPQVLSPFMRYSTEIIDTSLSAYQQTEEVYDFEGQYLITRTSPNFHSVKDFNRIVTVSDFVTQKKYTLDTVSKMCSISTEPEDLATEPNTAAIGGKAILYGPERFFFSDSKTVTYLGQKKIRGIVTDTWVAKTKDIQGSPDAIVQWNIAVPVKSWNDDNPDYQQKHYPIPLKFQLWSDSQTEAVTIQNVFHVDYNAPRPHHLDMTSCFENTTHIRLACRGSKDMIIDSDLEAFKYRLSKEISDAINIRWIQINQINLHYSQNDIIIELLFGSNDASFVSQRDQLVQKIKSGQLKISVYDKSTKKWTKTLPVNDISYVDLIDVDQMAKLKKLDESGKGGYGKGSMAGLGISMILIGLLGGVGLAFGHGKYFL